MSAFWAYTATAALQIYFGFLLTSQYGKPQYSPAENLFSALWAGSCFWTSYLLFMAGLAQKGM